MSAATLGYALATYTSAEDFLGSDHVNDTSCLITDLHLPGLSGLELYQRLRANGFAVPTIIVTGNPDETTRAQALAAGPVAFLSKPFGKKTMDDYVKTAFTWSWRSHRGSGDETAKMPSVDIRPRSHGGRQQKN
jgi:FixJ family two-component response regulator